MNRELHSSNPVIERAMLNRRLAKAKREWDSALFDILDNGRTTEKTERLKECRAKYGKIWFEITGKKMPDRNGGEA